MRDEIPMGSAIGLFGIVKPRQKAYVCYRKPTLFPSCMEIRSEMFPDVLVVLTFFAFIYLSDIRWDKD